MNITLARCGSMIRNYIKSIVNSHIPVNVETVHQSIAGQVGKNRHLTAVEQKLFFTPKVWLLSKFHGKCIYRKSKINCAGQLAFMLNKQFAHCFVEGIEKVMVKVKGHKS